MTSTDSEASSNPPIPRPRRWTLAKRSREPSQPSSSSSSDEDTAVYLMVNGDRARSRSSGLPYGPLTCVVHQKDFVVINMANNKSVRMPSSDLDVDAFSQEFDVASFDVEKLAGTLKPLLQSTPKPAPTSGRRKRQRLMGSQQSGSDQKYKGVLEVPLDRIEKPPPGYTLVGSNPERVERFKAAMVANPTFQVPLLPIMAAADDWDPETTPPQEATFYILGGCSLWEALIDLSSDDKFSHFRKVVVKVHAGLNQVQALQIGASFQREQTLLLDDPPTLQARVGICRTLLYGMHNLDLDVDEPPTRVQEDWRIQAAAALGHVSSCTKDRKPLETTFQLALYSRRCFAKLGRVFDLYQQQRGKPLKQTVFLQLQGLGEGDKFTILTRMVNGELKVEDVRKEALRLKRMGTVKREMMRLTRKKSWEQCCVVYPNHTSEDILEQFLGMEFGKSLPKDFVDFIEDADAATANGEETLDSLRADPVSLSLIEVDTTNGMRRATESLMGGSRTAAIITKQVAKAAAWQEELGRRGFTMLGESIILTNDGSAQHLIVGTNAGVFQSPPKVMEEGSFHRTLIDLYSQAGDRVASGVNNHDSFSKEANSMHRVCSKLRWIKGDSSQIVPPASTPNSSEDLFSSSSEDYVFSD